MNHKPSTTEKIARIMIALTIGLAGFIGIFLGAPAAYAFPEWRESQDNTPNGYGWVVTSSTDVDDPGGALVANTTCAGGNDITQIFETGNVIYDLGALYYVDSLETNGLDTVTAQVSVDGSSWDTIFSGNLNFEGACDTVQSSVGVEGVGGQVRYIRYLGVTGHTFYLNFFGVHIISLAATPTPTPSPSPTYATPLPPQPTACVAATARPTATQQKTPTPLAFSTLIPTHTPTPGGPTATPTPMVTGTPLPPSEFDSGIATFDSTLSPWTILTYDGPNEFEINASWSNAIGADLSRPGTAFLPYQIDTTALTRTVAPAGAIVFAMPSSATLPLRFTGEFMSDPVPAFHFHYIQVFYFDRDFNGPGQGVWSEIGIQPISSIWQRLDFTIPISISAGSGKVAAIALQGISSGTPVESEGGLTPGGYTFDSRTAGVFADNLRIASGPHAVPNSFPICPGPGGNTPPQQPTTKICIVLKLTVDIYGRCTPPTDPIDLIGWIKYQICRILSYFDFYDANRQQIADLVDRQIINEPWGSVIEMSDVTDVIGNTIKDILTFNQSHAVSNRSVEWPKLFDLRQLDAIASLLHKPVIDPNIVQEYRDRCPKLPDDNANTKLFNDYGCLVVTFVRDQTPIFSLVQWAIDLASIIGLVQYVRQAITRTQ